MLIRAIYFSIWNIPRPENYFLKDFSFGQNLFGVKNVLKDFWFLKDYPLKDFEDPCKSFPIPYAEVVNGTSTTVTERALQCDFAFSVSHDHMQNQSTIVGHVGKDAQMTFANPGTWIYSMRLKLWANNSIQFLALRSTVFTWVTWFMSLSTMESQLVEALNWKLFHAFWFPVHTLLRWLTMEQSIK